MDEEECTHEIIEYGRCAGCGDSIDYEDDDEWYADEDEREWEQALALMVAGLGRGRCQGRGWYHDGSEDQEAYIQKRAKKPCPYC